MPGVVLCPCYFQQSSTGHFLSVRSLFDVGSSAKSKSKSSPSNDKSRSSNRPSKSGRSKEKSRSITASPPLQPVPHLFPFSTVLRQFLGVRSWFVRGATPFCDFENTCLSRYRMGADKSGRFEHLPLTRYHALTVYRLTYQKLSTTGEVSSSHFVVSAKLRSQRLKVSVRKSNA